MLDERDTGRRAVVGITVGVGAGLVSELIALSGLLFTTPDQPSESYTPLIALPLVVGLVATSTISWVIGRRTKVTVQACILFVVLSVLPFLMFYDPRA